MQPWMLDDNLALLIGATRRRIKQVAWDLLRPFNVTPQQCGILLVLRGAGSMSLGALARQICCDNPTACRIVNKLVERGLITSRVDVSDPRRFHFRLTPTGKRLGEKLMGVSEDLAQAMEVSMSPDERRTVRRLLHQVMHNVENYKPLVSPRRSKKAAGARR